jgi:hypothetical protein
MCTDHGRGINVDIIVRELILLSLLIFLFITATVHWILSISSGGIV